MELRTVIGILWFLSPIIRALVIKDSVVFNKVSNIHTSRSFWKLTLVEDLESYEPKLSLANGQLEVLYDALKTLHEKIRRAGKKHWVRSFERLLVDYTDLKGEFDELKNEYSELQKLEGGEKGMREKRSLLPFIGSLTSFLFGTVSEDDLRAVKRSLRTLSLNQNTLMHVMNESLSLLNISRNDIGENRHQLNEAIGAINDLNRDLKRIQMESKTQILELEHVVRVYLQSVASFHRVKSNVATLFRHVRILQIHFNMLSLGRLSPVVIKPNTLLDILKAIKNKLTPPLMLVREPETNLWYYYRTLKASTVIHDNKLLVLIDIPLVNANSRLELFFKSTTYFFLEQGNFVPQLLNMKLGRLVWQ